MPIPNFQSNDNVNRGNIPPQIQNNPVLDKEVHFEDRVNTGVDEDVRSILPAGFSTMDKGVKTYFSDINVPTKDGMKKLHVRLAGGDKSILIYKQDFKSGRITLPVMSINRTSVSWMPERFTPAYIPVYKRFVNTSGDRMALGYREWPCIINYQLSIWTDRRQDMEYILYQIVTRFNPLAVFYIDDPYTKGSVVCKLESINNSSDIDVDAETQQKQRSDLDVKIEGWLPLPEKIVPAVLGKIHSISEENGTVLE